MTNSLNQTGSERFRALGRLPKGTMNKTEAAYRRGNLLEKRRVMMEDWANFCEGKKR